MKYLGLPRLDYLVKNDENTAEQIRGYYNITEQRKIVLYVPTFRKNSKVDLDSLVKAFDFNKYILVVKLHPLDIENLAKEKINISNGVIIDDRFTSYQWMNVCDKIITDYSALGIEATLKEKPVYFYIYDYKDYVKEVGLNINIKEEMCGYAEENAVILCKKMEEKYDFDILNKFKRKYISVKLNNCTERLAEFIVGLMEDGK